VELGIKVTPKTLTRAQKEQFDEEMLRLLQQYYSNNDTTSHMGLKNMIEYLKTAYQLVVMQLGLGCLLITVLCPTLDSLQSLWNDFCSDHLGHVVTGFLVTPELREIDGLQSITLETTIKEDDYLACRKFFLENPSESY